MKVLIKETAYDYTSDYPDGWLFSSGDYFKYPVPIGNYPCFIKRFEKKNPALISGWNLMVKLEHIYEHNLVRIYDIASVEEKAKRVYYVFYEYLHGNTLDNVISRNVPIDLTRLTNDLFSALASLEHYGHWFADFVEKNILLEESGRFVLMDLDSAQPNSKPPDNDMYGSKDYWVLVFDFYKNILKYNDLKVSDLPGLSLNQLNIIFLILRLKIAFDTRQQQYRHTEVFNELPAELDKMDPAVKEVFIKIYNERKDPQYADRAQEIKALIIKNIIHYNPAPPVHTSPVIINFAADNYTVEKGGTIDLKWKVKDVSSVELFKNGAFDSRFTADKTSVSKTAFYDGGAKSISYSLVAYKDGKQVESGPVEIFFKDKAVVPAPTPELKPAEPKPRPAPVPVPPIKRPIDFYIKLVLYPLLGLLVFGLLIRWWPKSAAEQLTVSGINPKYIFSREQTLTIYGKHFPQDTGIRVVLNNVPALIQAHSTDSIIVSYPETGDQSRWSGAVTVGVIVNNDTLYTPHSVYVLKNLTPPASGSNPDSVAVEPGTVTGDPTEITDKEKRKTDSINLMIFLKKQHDKLKNQ